MTKTPVPVSIRLDAETQQQLRRLAHETGGTMSSVVREAVAEYGAARERRAAAGSGPYDRLEHLIGVIDNRPDRSEQTGTAFREVLKAGARARRAR